MSKLLNKLYVRVIISAAIGFFFAGAYVDIEYPCPPLDSKGCASFESAIMHPADLLNNKQGSLTTSMKNFIIISLISFALLSVYSLLQTKKKV